MRQAEKLTQQLYTTSERPAEIVGNLTHFFAVVTLAARYQEALQSDLCEQDKMQILLCADWLEKKRNRQAIPEEARGSGSISLG